MNNKSVCIHCGHMKKSPFSRCGKCGYIGNLNPEEKAKSFMLSEEYLQGRNLQMSVQDKLQELSMKIKPNEMSEFDQDQLLKFIKEQEILKDIPPFQSIKIILFCSLFFIIPIIAILVWLFSA
ncbi:MAG: hypothetical protein LAT83_00545 [Kiritimatiellae bacterium]|nr:hypothetical protein [Kiritimatiellia bacterium]